MENANLLATLEPSASVDRADNNPYVIASAYRTLQVLQAFAAAPHRFGLTELGKRLGTEKNQLYRSLKTLEEAGFLETDDDGRFALTPLLHVLSAASAPKQQSVVDVARPYLDDLVAETRESVNLFVRAGELAVCVDRRDSPHQVRLASVLGMSVPLHAGAVPKAMLAFLPQGVQKQVLAQLATLPRYTEKTVLDPDALRREFTQIRTRGYSLSDEDYDASARGVGAPIFDQSGDVVAGLSVGGPSFRVNDDDLTTFAQLITRVAMSVSRRLGYTG